MNTSRKEMKSYHKVFKINTADYSFECTPIENDSGELQEFDFNISDIHTIAFTGNLNVLSVSYAFISNDNQRELLIYFDFYRRMILYSFHYHHNISEDYRNMLQEQNMLEITQLFPLFQALLLHSISLRSSYTHLCFIDHISNCKTNTQFHNLHKFAHSQKHILNYRILHNYYHHLSGI